MTLHTGEKGLKIPYVSYNGDKDWNKVSNAVYIQNSIVFNVFEPGEFVIIILTFLQMMFMKDILTVRISGFFYPNMT